MARPSSHKVAVLRGTLELPPIFSLFLIQDFHFLWLSIPEHFDIKKKYYAESETPRLTSRFGLLRFRSPLLTEYLKRGLFSFGYLDVSVLRVVLPTITPGYSILTERVGFPIRKPPI